MLEPAERAGAVTEMDEKACSDCRGILAIDIHHIEKIPLCSRRCRDTLQNEYVGHRTNGRNQALTARAGDCIAFASMAVAVTDR